MLPEFSRKFKELKGAFEKVEERDVLRASTYQGMTIACCGDSW